MAKLYLIRHGETDYNNAMRFQGRTDILLNQKGIEQAEKAAEFFRDIPLQAIYTSSLKRARTTAEIIGKVKGLEPQATDALQEMSFGIWENMNSKDIQKKYAKEWKDFFASPATTTIRWMCRNAPILLYRKSWISIRMATWRLWPTEALSVC